MINSSNPYKSLNSSRIGKRTSKYYPFLIALVLFSLFSCTKEVPINNDHLLPETRTLKGIRVDNPLLMQKGDTLYVNKQLLSGDIQLQYETGEAKSNASYKNGLKHGRYLEYFYTGELKTHAIFTEGIIEGWYKSFHPDGKLSELYYQSNGQKQGKHSRWYQDGQIMSFAEFENGIMIKEVQYDTRNNIVKNIVYKNGRNYGKPRAKYCGN